MKVKKKKTMKFTKEKKEFFFYLAIDNLINFTH